uniref:Uncharacterized protein n=1 Tax=Tanacetum cinerariifolium TaxID=118510 RepID=A0A6L2KLW0_TANCI|nr:hypothetical protein [Tanacetum cinerariifolium]
MEGEGSTVLVDSIFPTHTHVADEAASTGVDVRHGVASTIVTSLDAEQGSGNIDKTLSMPHDSPLIRVNILGSDEGRMQHNELMDFVTKLSDQSSSFGGRLKANKEDKGKDIMEESESDVTKTKRQQEQERLGLETVVRLQEQFYEEERQRIGKEQVSKVDQAKMLVDLINQRKRYFAKQKAEAKRKKPMTQAQQMTYIFNYIKHMGSYTLK